MAYPQGPAPALPDRHGGALRVDAAKCAAGCSACVPVCPTKAITRPPGPGGARPRPLPLLLRLRRGLPAGPSRRPRPSHGRAPARGPRARLTRAEELRLAARSTKNCAALRPLAAPPAGQRRRLRRLRGRRQRARHHRLGPGALRHPVRRLAPPCRRPAHHRPGLAKGMELALRKTWDAVPEPKSSSPSGPAPSPAAPLSATPKSSTAPPPSSPSTSTGAEPKITTALPPHHKAARRPLHPRLPAAPPHHPGRPPPPPTSYTPGAFGGIRFSTGLSSTFGVDAQPGKSSAIAMTTALLRRDMFIKLIYPAIRINHAGRRPKFSRVIG
jgi:ferredoxin